MDVTETEKEDASSDDVTMSMLGPCSCLDEPLCFTYRSTRGARGV